MFRNTKSCTHEPGSVSYFVRSESSAPGSPAVASRPIKVPAFDPVVLEDVAADPLAGVKWPQRYCFKFLSPDGSQIVYVTVRLSLSSPPADERWSTIRLGLVLLSVRFDV